jgi:hypothetical protein
MPSEFEILFIHLTSCNVTVWSPCHVIIELLQLICFIIIIYCIKYLFVLLPLRFWLSLHKDRTLDTPVYPGGGIRSTTYELGTNAASSTF